MSSSASRKKKHRRAQSVSISKKDSSKGFQIDQRKTYKKKRRISTSSLGSLVEDRDEKEPPDEVKDKYERRKQRKLRNPRKEKPKNTKGKKKRKKNKREQQRSQTPEAPYKRDVLFFPLV
jgi:hypothetical protein